MPRPRLYVSDAERVAAYRARLRAAQRLADLERAQRAAEMQRERIAEQEAQAKCLRYLDTWYRAATGEPGDWRSIWNLLHFGNVTLVPAAPGGNETPGVSVEVGEGRA